MKLVAFVTSWPIIGLVVILDLFCAAPWGRTPVWSAAGAGLKSDQTSPLPVGLFENHSDVGNPRHAGAVEYDPERKSYLITGGGKNMWGQEDAFHFVWKRMSGDVALTASIRWPNPGKEPHRKACLLIRQSLDADSAYVDAAVHGDGLTSLQYRPARGERTCEIQSNVSRPIR